MNGALDWGIIKRMSTLFAAIALLTLSALNMQGGLNFGGEYAVLVTWTIWGSMTIIQFVGNDMENHQDYIFSALWVFSYLLGIGAGAWALYGWINIPNVWLHWMCAFGLGGAAEIAPERLLVMFLRSGAFKNVRIQSQMVQPMGGGNRSMGQSGGGNYNNQPRQQSYQPQSQQQQSRQFSGNNKPQQSMGPSGQFKKQSMPQEPVRKTYIVAPPEDIDDDDDDAPVYLARR